MEEEKFSQKQSIDLISQMISKTQQRIRSNGISFIVWGYVTVVVSLIAYTALLLTGGDERANLLWFLIPICGTPLHYLFTRSREPQEPHVHTFIDSVVEKIWITFGVAVVLLMIASFIRSLPILFIVAFVIGMGSALTGLVIRYRIITVSGSLSMALSFICLFLNDWMLEILVFAGIFLLTQVIPGHILNYRYHKEED